MVFEDGVPAMFVLWHGRLLSSSFRYRHKGVATLITRSRDGDYITGAIESWGFKVLRGSSSRGGTESLRGIVRLLRSGVSVAVTPDGPRGPRQKMKIGPLYAAQMAGVPIIPATAGATRGRFFGSWDRFLVPAPFAWTPVAFGEPIRINASATEADLLRAADEIEAKLNQLTKLVDEAARARR
jgi:lysophospholipid acyltransferase (LPLAT)-like uncharacterized protein